MSNTGNSIKWETIREIDAASLTTSFQALGGVFTRDSFRITLTNNTNGTVYFSIDGINEQLKFPGETARIYDNKTNDMFVRAGTQFSVKWDVAPGAPAGWVSLEVEYV